MIQLEKEAFEFWSVAFLVEEEKRQQKTMNNDWT